MGSTNWIDRLPGFDGELRLSDDALELASLDFGKVRCRRPRAVLRPAHTGDVVEAVRFCRREGVALSARGHAHSAGGQMMAEGGLVVDLKSMQRVHAITDDWIEVDGGIAWSDVLRAAVDRGRTPPVVTDWLAVSVGGTVSMGGFGFMSFHRGTQMDHLLELEVVTGEGECVVCSPEQNRALFDAVRATHGQFAWITRARIPLERAPEGVRMVQAAYGDVRSMLGDMERLAAGHETDLIHAFAAEKGRAAVMTRMNSTDAMQLDPHVVDAALTDVAGRWVYNLEVSDLIGERRPGRRMDLAALRHLPGCVDTWELSWEAFCFRLPPLILEEELKGAAPHPELTVFVPFGEASTRQMEAEFARLDPVGDIGGGPVLFFPLERRKIGAPHLRLPAAERSFFLGLLRRAEPPTAGRIATQLADNEAIYARALGLGGVRYLPDTVPDDPAFWPKHFGEDWARLRSLKRRWDPDGVFRSSFGAQLLASDA